MLVCDNDARHIANDYSPNKFYPSPYTHTLSFFSPLLVDEFIQTFHLPHMLRKQGVKVSWPNSKITFRLNRFIRLCGTFCSLSRFPVHFDENRFSVGNFDYIFHYQNGCLTWSHVHSGGIQCTSKIPLNFSSERNFYVCMCVWQSFFCTTEHMPARHLPICYFSTCTPSHSVLVLSLRRWRIHFVCIFRESYSRVWHIFKFSAWCFCLYRVFFAHVSLSCCIFLIFERAHSIARPSSRDTTE